MIKKILFILAITINFAYTTRVSASCTIENGPISELAEYERAIQDRIAELQQKANQDTTACKKSKNGISDAIQTIDVIDSAIVKLPIFDNTFLDFLYTFQTIFDGNVRAPVLRDGQLFLKIEQRINSSIDNMARTCGLQGSVRQEFVQLLTDNSTLENVYKQAVLGTPVDPSGLDDNISKVASAINANYIPPKIAQCKTENNLEDIVTKIQNRIERNGIKNQNALEDWRVAIKLFRGGGSGDNDLVKVADIQRKLLQKELARQGLTNRMSQTILKNFDCYKAETAHDSSAEAAVKARMKCLSNPILGIEKLMLPWRKKVDKARITDERVQATRVLIKQKDIKTEIQTTYSKVQTITSPESDNKIEIITNLVDLHVSLTVAIDLIKKRLPIMQKNCMKGQPGITGGCRD